MNFLPSKLQQAATMSYDDRRALLRFGFELETQETNGHKRAEDEGGTESLYRAHYRSVAEVRVQTNKYNIADLVSAIRSRFDYWHARKRETLQTLLETLSVKTLQDLVDRGLMNQSDADEVRVQYSGVSVRGHLLEVITENLQSSEDEEIPGILTKPIKAIDIGTDMTVRGFEFRTIDGHHYDDIIQIAASLIGDNKHVIDHGCSFHIHVSFPGVFEPVIKPCGDEVYEDANWATERTTNTGFAAQCVASLMDNIDLVPTDVLERWLNTETRNNFLFRIGAREKYEFVHIHESGTIEFRCFGNVSTVSDAELCINLACSAIWDALDNKYPLVVPYLIPTDYETLIETYLQKISNEFNHRKIAA